MTLLIFVKCGNVCFIGGYLWLISLLMVLNYSLFYYPIFCFFDLLMRTSKRHCSSVVIHWCHLHPNGGGRGLLMNWWMQELVVNPMMHHKMQVVNTVRMYVHMRITGLGVIFKFVTHHERWSVVWWFTTRVCWLLHTHLLPTFVACVLFLICF